MTTLASTSPPGRCTTSASSSTAGRPRRLQRARAGSPRTIAALDGATPTARRVERIAATLREGESDQGGQTLAPPGRCTGVRDACRTEDRTVFERADRSARERPHRAPRTRLRLQPYIAGSIDAPIRARALRHAWTTSLRASRSADTPPLAEPSVLRSRSAALMLLANARMAGLARAEPTAAVHLPGR